MQSHKKPSKLHNYCSTLLLIWWKMLTQVSVHLTWSCSGQGQQLKYSLNAHINTSDRLPLKFKSYGFH